MRGKEVGCGGQAVLCRGHRKRWTGSGGPGGSTPQMTVAAAGVSGTVRGPLGRREMCGGENVWMMGCEGCPEEKERTRRKENLQSPLCALGWISVCQTRLHRTRVVFESWAKAEAKLESDDEQ